MSQYRSYLIFVILGVAVVVAFQNCDSKLKTVQDNVSALNLKTPKIEFISADVTVNSGASLLLEVRASGPSLSFQWLKNSVNLVGENQSQFRIATVQDIDAGNYQVQVTNPNGQITSAMIQVAVRPPASGQPVIVRQPENQALRVGDRLELNVQAAGADLAYQWHKNSTPISGETSPTLIITSVVRADAASYSVVVSNPAGSIASSAAVVSVLDTSVPPPAIVTQPTDQTLNVGERLTLQVQATGSALAYEWRKNSTVLSGKTLNTLTIDPVATTDSGSYSVVVSNPGGTVTSRSATVTVNSVGGERAPNVVLIFIDDAGVGWSPVLVPAITSLANQGVVVRQAYAQPECSPSRAHLITGRYAQKWGHYRNSPDFADGVQLPANVVTWPRNLQTAGVKTGFVGKWHIYGRNPWEAGFDESPLWFRGGAHDYFLPGGGVSALMANKTTAPPLSEPDHLTDRFAAAAVDFISRAKTGANPFFLYLAPNGIHIPDQSEARYSESSECRGFPVSTGQRAYCGNVLHINELVARVKAAVPANTLIIFTSDNGCAKRSQPSCNNGNLNGGKSSFIFEGATRVPFAAYWKDHLTSQVVEGPIVLRDLGPTILAVQKAAPLNNPDGVNILPFLKGEALAPTRDIVVGSKVEGTIRRGRWKWTTERKLYDLQADPGEANNVAAANASIAAELSAARADFVRSWP